MTAQLPRPRPARPVEANIARSTDTLITYHGIGREDVASALRLSTDTLGRRLKFGGWTVMEQEIVAAYFSVPRDDLLSGDVRPAQSRLDPKAAQALSMYFDVAADLALYDAEAVSVA